MKFIDEVEITVSSGKGGPGSVSFRREAMVPRGGPDGGDGGRGGDVIFRVDPQLGTLLDLRMKRTYSAENGEPGESQNRSGRDGQDLVLKVPPGTIVKSQSGAVLLDLSEIGDHKFLIGGKGGKGNVFYKSSVNQAPSIAQKGEAGKTEIIQLELKLIADVGIIGYPNAGKSTLISKISAAKPKVADYPFTTLVPNLGVVRVDEDFSYVVADIPGLVPGAHKGVGLGTQFLRHIERTQLFIHLIDASGFSGREPYQDYQDIQNELTLYDEARDDADIFQPLGSREQIVVLNKVEVAEPKWLEEVERQFLRKKVPILKISAVSGQNLPVMLKEISEHVRKGRMHGAT